VELRQLARLAGNLAGRRACPHHLAQTGRHGVVQGGRDRGQSGFLADGRGGGAGARFT
jgi:hypothetical protein